MNIVSCIKTVAHFGTVSGAGSNAGHLVVELLQAAEDINEHLEWIEDPDTARAMQRELNAIYALLDVVRSTNYSAFAALKSQLDREDASLFDDDDA